MIVLDTEPTLIIRQRFQLSNDEINDWNKLRKEEKGSLFSSYAWVKAGVNSIEQGKNIIVALGYQYNKLIFVLPLVIQEFLFFSYAYSPTRKFLDQSCILSQSDLLLPFFIGQIKLLIKNFIIYEVSESLKDKLSQLFSPILIEHASTSFSLNLKRLEPCYNFSKKSFKKLLKLEQQGDFQLKILTSHNIIPTDIFDFELISTKAGTKKAVFLEQQYKNFFIELIKFPYIHLYLLKKGEDIVALDLGGQCYGEIFSLYCAYNSKYQQYSPGNILLHQQIQEAIKNDFTYYHLYRGYTYQKKRFANVLYEQYNLYFFSNPLLKAYFQIKLYIVSLSISLKSFIKKIMYIKKNV